MSAPIRVLELRSVRGTGGGPEKTILLGAHRCDPSRVRVAVAYVRDRRDDAFGVDDRARQLGLDYLELHESHSFDARTLAPLVRAIRARQIDIVHSHDYKANALALLASLITRVPVVVTEHGWTGDLWRERRLYYPLDRRLVRFCRRIIAVSENIRQQLIRSGVAPARIVTLVNGIDARTFRRRAARRTEVRTRIGLDDGAFVIGAVGRLERQKRFDLLIETFAALARVDPRLRLVIAGDGGERERLEAIVRGCGVESVCRMLGHRADVADLHNAFDLFVQTSDYEGTPNAVLESMALETPTVATDAGGTRQLIVDGVHGWLVPCGDRAGLGSAVRQAIADPETRARVAAAARCRVEDTLSFDARQASLEALYADVLTPGPTGPPRMSPSPA